MEDRYNKINKIVPWKVIIATMVIIVLSFCLVFWFVLPSEFLGIHSPVLENKLKELQKLK